MLYKISLLLCLTWILCKPFSDDDRLRTVPPNTEVFCTVYDYARKTDLSMGYWNPERNLEIGAFYLLIFFKKRYLSNNYSKKTEYAFFSENFGGKSYAAARARRHSSSQVTFAMGISFPDLRSILFEFEIPYILLFVNRNKNN